MNRKINLLMLAYVFPPALGSGSFRPLAFANNLQALGLGVHVLSVSNYGLDNSALDLALCKKIDPRVHVYRARRYRSPREFLLHIKERLGGSGNTPTSGLNGTNRSRRSPGFLKPFASIRTVISELLSYPDNQIGWAPAAYALGKELIRDKQINVLFVTGGPWSSLLVGVLLKKFSGLPVVLDFRDPWVSNPNTLDHSTMFRWLNAMTESFCIKHCDAIIANTDELRQDFLVRYPLLSPTKIHTITNGFDTLYVLPDRRNEKFTITHAGVFYISRNPKQFLRAIRELIMEARIPHNKILVNLVGALDVNDRELATILSDERLKSAVRLIPSVSHEVALQFQLTSDVLMLIQPNLPLQVPRKLFEYLAVQRPILAITEQSGATASIIRKAGTGIVVANEVPEIKEAVVKLYERWIRLPQTEMPQGELQQFDNALLARKLRDILEDMVARRYE